MKTTKHKGYTVHSDGSIEKKCGTGYIKPYLRKDGYLQMLVAEDGKHNSEYIHRFIWQAFNGEIPDGLTIDHIDNNPANNRLDNLQLLTNTENPSKANQIFTKAQLDEIRYLRNDLRWTQKRIANKFDVHPATIHYLQKKGFRYVY